MSLHTRTMREQTLRPNHDRWKPGVSRVNEWWNSKRLWEFMNAYLYTDPFLMRMRASYRLRWTACSILLQFWVYFKTFLIRLQYYYKILVLAISFVIFIKKVWASEICFQSFLVQLNIRSYLSSSIQQKLILDYFTSKKKCSSTIYTSVIFRRKINNQNHVLLLLSFNFDRNDKDQQWNRELYYNGNLKWIYNSSLKIKYWTNTIWPHVDFWIYLVIYVLE